MRTTGFTSSRQPALTGPAVRSSASWSHGSKTGDGSRIRPSFLTEPLPVLARQIGEEDAPEAITGPSETCGPETMSRAPIEEGKLRIQRVPFARTSVLARAPPPESPREAKRRSGPLSSSQSGYRSRGRRADRGAPVEATPTCRGWLPPIAHLPNRAVNPLGTDDVRRQSRSRIRDRGCSRHRRRFNIDRNRSAAESVGKPPGEVEEGGSAPLGPNAPAGLGGPRRLGQGGTARRQQNRAKENGSQDLSHDILL